MTTLDAKILKLNYVDVCAGPMTPEQAGNELTHYMRVYSPDNMVVTIAPSDQLKKHYVSIYITNKAFKTGYIHDI